MHNVTAAKFARIKHRTVILHASFIDIPLGRDRDFITVVIVRDSVHGYF